MNRITVDLYYSIINLLHIDTYIEPINSDRLLQKQETPTGVKMKIKIAILFGLLLGSSMAHADEPLKSINRFESNIKSCLLNDKDPGGCLANTMQGHFSPGNEKLNSVVKQVASVLTQWLAGSKVFALHPVKKKALGDFYEERVYLIEDRTGSIIMLETAYVSTLGKWYLHRFNLSSKKETMQAVLGVSL